MSATWFKVGTGYCGRIEPVEVVKFTEHRVTVIETRWSGKPEEKQRNRSSTYEEYLPTYAEARDWLIARALRNYERAQEALDNAAHNLAKAEAIPESQP